MEEIEEKEMGEGDGSCGREGEGEVEEELYIHCTAQ